MYNITPKLSASMSTVCQKASPTNSNLYVNKNTTESVASNPPEMSKLLSEESRQELAEY
jgi:hypothetical protein